MAGVQQAPASPAVAVGSRLFGHRDLPKQQLAAFSIVKLFFFLPLKTWECYFEKNYSGISKHF